jgi:hypothetical protein
LIYAERGGAIHLLDCLLDLALVLENRVDEGAFWPNVALSVGHDFAVAGNFFEDLLSLDIFGKVLDDNCVPVLVVLNLARVGVGVLHVEFELFF